MSNCCPVSVVILHRTHTRILTPIPSYKQSECIKLMPFCLHSLPSSFFNHHYYCYRCDTNLEKYIEENGQEEEEEEEEEEGGVGKEQVLPQSYAIIAPGRETSYNSTVGGGVLSETNLSLQDELFRMSTGMIQ